MNEFESCELDLSPLLVPNIRFAVRCESEEEAKQFIKAVMDKFPEKETILSPWDTRWRNDNNGDYGGRAYFPDLNNVEQERFMHGDMDYARVNGYKLVYFRDLVVAQTSIDESDFPLDMILGSGE